MRETVLPDWWDDDAARSPAGFAESALIISRHTGISLESLRKLEPEAPKPAAAKFKLASKNAVLRERLDWDAIPDAGVDFLSRMAKLGDVVD